MVGDCDGIAVGLALGLKLGRKLMEESKIAVERQQEEIDALHRSQEKAETRGSHVHVES